MKKLLFVIPTMRMGGAEQSLVSLLKSLDLNNYDVDLLLLEKNGELLERLPERVNVVAADTVTRAMVLEFRYFFKDLINEHHYLTALIRLMMLANSKIENVTGKKIIFNWNIAKHFIQAMLKEYDVAVGYLEGIADAFIIDKVKAKRKIGWIHTNFGKSNRHFSAEGKYYRQFDSVAIISDECKKCFLNFYPDLEEKVYVIENITDKDFVLKKAQEPIEEVIHWDNPCVVTVGRLEAIKGIDIALDAAKILRDKGIKFVWHVFGDGILKNELIEKIRSYHLDGCFYLNGTTRNPYKYIKKADIIVQPSRNEGKSMVLDEAKILCRPIVVTNYPSAKDQIRNGETGIIVDIDSRSIATGIENLINSPMLRNHLEEQCGLENDNTDATLKKIVAMIEGD